MGRKFQMTKMVVLIGTEKVENLIFLHVVLPVKMVSALTTFDQLDKKPAFFSLNFSVRIIRFD